MVDDIDISHGGAISVDTETLRALLPRFEAAAGCLADAHIALRSVGWHVLMDSRLEWSHPVRWMGSAIGNLAEDAHQFAAFVRLMADAYEIVEARAEQEMAGLTGGWVKALWPTADLLLRAHTNPRAAMLAELLIAQWLRDRRAGFVEQGLIAGPASPLAVLLLWLAGKQIDEAGFGRIPAGSTLRGPAPPVTLYHRDLEGVVPPKGVHDFMSRIPRKIGQVRVERYTMPDGTNRFAVHIAGTKEVLGDDPWNMASNIDLYVKGEMSESYAATVAALEEAGARPGDTLYINGHSQGAMIGGRLLMSELFEVPLIATAGMPVTIVVSDRTRHVDVRHTDDPVTALAQGGAMAGTGATGSVLVERIGDPSLGLQDLTMKTHLLDTYLDTVAMFENSGDVRVAEVQALVRELEQAVSVEATEFYASSGAPG